VLIECVVNLSEGRDQAILSALDAAAGPTLRDRHSDPDHHRSVYTLVGDDTEVVASARSLAAAAVRRLDLASHVGAHPRLGVLDVVPFVPYKPGRPAPHDLHQVTALRDDFAQWLAREHGVPAFTYGPLAGGGSRSLPDLRRQAFKELQPDAGPATPHPTAGATAVGARAVLVAYNVWVSSVEIATEVAPAVREPAVRALGLAVGRRAQVSCNLVEPDVYGPDRLYDTVAELAAKAGGRALGAELVGLIPSAVLEHIPAARWPELDLAAERTVEARL
jgi:glutamate formiminotransferase